MKEVGGTSIMLGGGENLDKGPEQSVQIWGKWLVLYDWNEDCIGGDGRRRGWSWFGRNSM